MRPHVILIVAAVLTACVSDPGIVQLSPDTYMLARTDKGGIFGNAEAMKVRVIQQANDFAASKGKIAVPVASHETSMAPGRFASFEYQFRVVDPNDPEARRTALVPRPDVVVEKTEKSTVDVTVKDQQAHSKDIYSELLKLDDLHKRGILTDAEYEAQKAKLLKNN